MTTALADKLLALADDEYLLGHRNAEWTGHAPILEEDIAFANIAQDELGHAMLWLGLHKELTNGDPDRLMFFRAANEYRNAQLCELPKGDWAFSMMRQFLFDAAELARLPFLIKSADARLRQIAAKIHPEELYHYRHTSNWIKRLGQGTEESHRRTQSALEALWPFARQLFVPLPNEGELVAAAIVPSPETTLHEWRQLVEPLLSQSGLTIPSQSPAVTDSRQTHTPHLATLLDDMQEVARLEGPEVKW